MNLVALCDFDGTITRIDTAEWVLGKFAKGDWRQYDRQFEKGEIELEECLNKEFSLVKASEEQILEELKTVVTFRPNFKKFGEFCKENSIPLIIVSAGLDFVIKHFLQANNCLDLVTVYAAKTTFSLEGIKLTFPIMFDNSSDNFKHDMVRHYSSQNMKVMYIGDGLADYAGAKDADFAFVIEGSRLAKLCKTHRILCKSITGFQEITEAIREIEP
jgi:2-hydroxy-3-keto-5-methylthiopentenyl-1-phosphate phosphatase